MKHIVFYCVLFFVVDVSAIITLAILGYNLIAAYLTIPLVALILWLLFVLLADLWRDGI